MPYALKMNGTERLVHSFNRGMQIVAAAKDPKDAKTFPTREKAEAWGLKYKDAGYGLETFEVVEVSK